MENERWGSQVCCGDVLVPLREDCPRCGKTALPEERDNFEIPPKYQSSGFWEEADND